MPQTPRKLRSTAYVLPAPCLSGRWAAACCASPYSSVFLSWRGDRTDVLAGFPWEHQDRAEQKPGLPPAASRVPRGAEGVTGGGGCRRRPGWLQALLQPGGWQHRTQVPQHLLQRHRCPRRPLLLHSPGEGKTGGPCCPRKQIP